MSDEIIVKFGNRLKDLRKAKGFSQEAFAHEIGVDRTYIGKIERAERNISLKTIGKIAKALSIEPIDLFVFNESN